MLNLLHYDAAGNLISKMDSSGTTTYGYDVANNLTSLTPPVGASSAFAYDVDGTRVSTSDSRGQLTQIYVGGGLYMEFSTDGALNLYQPGIGQFVNNVGNVYLGDAQGSTVAMSGVGESISGEYKYDAWGNRLTGPPSWQTPFAYVGGEGYVSDPDTGLMKLGVRYYDPSIGRFITKDPARDGWNWYEYAGNDLVMNTDPTGFGYWKDVGNVFCVYGQRIAAKGTPLMISMRTDQHGHQDRGTAWRVPQRGDAESFRKERPPPQRRAHSILGREGRYSGAGDAN